MKWFMERNYISRRILPYFLFLRKSHEKTAHEIIFSHCRIILNTPGTAVGSDVGYKRRCKDTVLQSLNEMYYFQWAAQHISQTPERVKHGIITTALPRQYEQTYHIPYQWNTLDFPNVTLTVSRLAWSPWQYRLKPIQAVPCQEKKKKS